MISQYSEITEDNAQQNCKINQMQFLKGNRKDEAAENKMLKLEFIAVVAVKLNLSCKKFLMNFNDS